MQPTAFKEVIGRLRNLERILDNLSEGIIVHDLDRRVVFFNRMAEDMTGYKREDILDKDCHEAFGRPFCGPFCLFCEHNTDTTVHKINQKAAFVTKNGQTLNLEMSITVILDDDGQSIGVLAAFKDYTEILKIKLNSSSSSITNFYNIIGQDPKMIDVFRQIQDVAAYDFPVYIFGETGTGKELAARAIHENSIRKNNHFVPINCGALPEGLLESELFGHVRGAFSGAVKDKKGRLELADKGTVFLDEIGELPLAAQTRLLRFLQEGVLERVGSTTSVKVDAHVICATNKDLKQEVAKGFFREDLYYRLNVIPLVMPPLRERKSDMPLLVEHFLKRTATHYGAANTPRLNAETLTLLEFYDWPGNIRELQNALQYAFVKSQGANIITVKDLPLEFKNLRSAKKTGNPRASGSEVSRSSEPQLTRFAIENAIKQARGNKSKAAKILGIGRATLYRHLND